MSLPSATYSATMRIEKGVRMEPAKALKIAMRRAGVTATGLAEDIGTNQQRVSQWRTGTYNLSRKAILKLAEHLDCYAAWLSGAACR